MAEHEKFVLQNTPYIFSQSFFLSHIISDALNFRCSGVIYAGTFSVVCTSVFRRSHIVTGTDYYYNEIIIIIINIIYITSTSTTKSSVCCINIDNITLTFIPMTHFLLTIY
jgi:hypothetical protein